MLRLAQGKVPFHVLTEHLGHKVSHEALLKLNDTIINQPQHLSRRSLVILYHLYGIGNKIIREFLYISRNTVKRYIYKFNESGVESLLNTHHKAIHVLDDSKIKETILSILHTPPREFGYNRTVCLQMVLDKLCLKLRDGFSSHIYLSCNFSKFQKTFLLPS
jgi:hypothetical protein